jgi:antitoxin HicB
MMEQLMAETWIFGVDLRHEAGEVHAYSDELPEAIAAGATDDAALREMAEALRMAVRGRIKDGMDLSPPRAVRRGEVAVPLPPALAAKAAIYCAWKRSGLSKTALGDRIGRNEVEVRRILDPDYGTKLDQMAEAAAGLGGRLTVAFEPSAS